jgi:hypothetical protein
MTTKSFCLGNEKRMTTTNPSAIHKSMFYILSDKFLLNHALAQTTEPPHVRRPETGKEVRVESEVLERMSQTREFTSTHPTIFFVLFSKSFSNDFVFRGMSSKKAFSEISMEKFLCCFSFRSRSCFFCQSISVLEAEKIDNANFTVAETSMIRL